eukprot:TRINITY_DN9399_c0_g1_i1.p1 TRINITY_DN9399_c0_g1~~TRINITY_DN9399_c0_g1_i1.p1  ORF type:complete len:600 (-),score=173.57 TRINITY_DN9399_c0_g1_i1:56-1855(-)
MKDYADFTIDPLRFRYLGDFVKHLHKKKIHWVPIIDAGLKYNPEDKYYKLGEMHNAFIRSAETKKVLIARVWPGAAVFLSWFAPRASEIWHVGLQDLHNEAEFDGIWLDMNEVASFCPGECPPDGDRDYEFNEWEMNENFEDWERLEAIYRENEGKEELGAEGADPHDPREFDSLPYVPGNKSLIAKTISLTAYHPTNDSDGDRLWKEYNTHGLWNLYQSKSTYEFFTLKLKKRPFIVTRSNFPGTGLYSNVWLGDNHSLWEYLRTSIVGIFNYQLFGVPLVGEDLCGFLGNSTEELCLRWMQLGAFYPFTRNHNDLNSDPQEPYAFGERVLVASRNAIRQKYSILRYYYTKLFEVSLYGGTLIRPVFFEFPNGNACYLYMNDYFMIGSSILVIPVLRRNVKELGLRLPCENWYDLRTQRKVLNYSASEMFVKLPASEEYVNVLVRGGSVVPYQDAQAARVRRVETLNVLPMEIIVAPDRIGEASGNLITDNKDELDTIEKKAYRHLEFKFSKTNKNLLVNKNSTWPSPTHRFEAFSRLTILGVKEWENVTSLCAELTRGRKEQVTGMYDQEKEKLTFYKPRSGFDWIDITSITFNSTC